MDNLNLNQKVIDSHSKNQKECLASFTKRQIFFDIHIKIKQNHFKDKHIHKNIFKNQNYFYQGYNEFINLLKVFCKIQTNIYIENI